MIGYFDNSMVSYTHRFEYRWFLEVQNIYYNGNKRKLLPKSNQPQLVESYFNCAATLMTSQLQTLFTGANACRSLCPLVGWSVRRSDNAFVRWSTQRSCLDYLAWFTDLTHVFFLYNRNCASSHYVSLLQALLLCRLTYLSLHIMYMQRQSRPIVTRLGLFDFPFARSHHFSCTVA